jgi:hypothetical protein
MVRRHRCEAARKALHRPAYARHSTMSGALRSRVLGRSQRVHVLPQDSQLLAPTSPTNLESSCADYLDAKTAEELQKWSYKC